jgi:hypothetical protein
VPVDCSEEDAVVEDEVEALVGVEVERDVAVEMVAEEDEVVELDAAAPTASENVPMLGSLLPSPE